MKNKNNTYNYQKKEYKKLYNAKPTNGRYLFPPSGCPCSLQCFVAVEINILLLLNPLH